MEVAVVISITVAIISAIAAIFGMYMAFKNYNRFINKDVREDSQAAGNLQSDVSYIKRRIDDVLLEQKEASKIIADHSERLARVEESAKQAHKRIDAVEQKINEG